MSSTRCQREGCTRRATLLPKMLLRASEDDEPVKADINIEVCQLCSQDLRASTIVDDAGWAIVRANFLKVHMRVPRRDLTEVVFEPIGRGSRNGTRVNTS